MIHNDHLGTPQKMTDALGTLVWAADYKPFGEANVTISTITNNLRFPGQYFDAETGLNYNYFRNYNPQIGRYMTVDRVNLTTLQLPLPLLCQELIEITTLGEKRLKELVFKYVQYYPQLVVDLYAYAGNSPINWMDPSGDLYPPQIVIGAVVMLTAMGVMAANYFGAMMHPQAPAEYLATMYCVSRNRQL
jgi:RHS repeat-associated protein